jgi:serine acetyltransferase
MGSAIVGVYGASFSATTATSKMCNGNVYVDDRAYVGTDPLLVQGTLEKRLAIGAVANVGKGAVVPKAVVPGITGAGNPVRFMEKKNYAQYESCTLAILH